MHREIRRGGEKDAHKQVTMLISSPVCLVKIKILEAPHCPSKPPMVVSGISNESEATKAASLSVNAALPLHFDAGSASQSVGKVVPAANGLDSGELK